MRWSRRRDLIILRVTEVYRCAQILHRGLTEANPHHPQFKNFIYGKHAKFKHIINC